MQVHIHHDAQHIAHLVGDLFQQSTRISHTHRLAVVATTNFQHAAFSIGETAYPLQIVVPPYGLPFPLLVFTHTNRTLSFRMPARSSDFSAPLHQEPQGYHRA